MRKVEEGERLERCNLFVQQQVLLGILGSPQLLASGLQLLQFCNADFD